MGRGEYGICPSCKKYKYLSGTTCKTCSYQMGTCLACEKQSKIYVDGLCYLCYQDRQVLATIESLERGFHPLNDYNKQLFQLYLSYIKRYRLFYAHIRITKELINVLQNDEISIISGWFDIYMLSDRYVIMQKPQKLQGCVFIKIGNMLSELGIISPREDDRDHELQNKLSCLVTPNVQDFVNDLLKINTAKRSIIHILRELTLLETFAIQGFEIYSLFLLDRFHLLQFFDQQVELTNSEHNRKKLYLDIKRFYRWAILNRHININPVPEIRMGHPAGKLVICSDQQFFTLKKYIRHKDTNPEKAILLSLVLFFGFSTIQLAQSQVVIQNDKLCIKIRKRKLTKGKKYYCRKELLELPQNPEWFLRLQKKFFSNWSEHYKKVKKTYPNTPLVLPKSNISNRYLNTDTVRSRVEEATKEATGNIIPIRVLKQTCGHIYSSKADASILSSLGWSDQFAFHYTWLPRTYYPETTQD